MKIKKSKGLSMLLSFLMAFSVLSGGGAVKAMAEGTAVSTYIELTAALANKASVIQLNQVITVTGTILVNYNCTITSSNGSGLIRGDGFTQALLSTGGVADGTSTTLILDKVVIDGKNLAANAAAVSVDENTTLILQNTTIQNNVNSEAGGGIYNKGTLEMSDGSLISGNTAYEGGGVYNAGPDIIYNSGIREAEFPVIFNMKGGEISDNTATSTSNDAIGAGGGVAVVRNSDFHGIFYMDGGKITRNSTPGFGGGVTLDSGNDENDMLFQMTGGEITDNTAGMEGGGVWLADNLMVMTGGLIARNTAGEEGGGISGYPMGDNNLNMTGGIITLNAASTGGGIGHEVGGIVLADNIYDNLASDGGDDVVFDGTVSLELNNQLPARPYGASYASSVPLSSKMQGLIAAAQLTLNVELIPSAPIPTGVMIPFYGWFVDGFGGYSNTENIPRYSGIEGKKFDLNSTSLNLIKSYYDYETAQNVVGQEGTALKSIWYGLVLLYDANYEGGSQQYDPKAYLPGTDALVLDSMFTKESYQFTGWNTKPDGSGTAYQPGADLTMNNSTLLYAQWANPASSLSIAKSASQSTYTTAGEVITYSYLVTNTGNTPLSGITVSDDKIEGDISVPDLAPSAQATVTANYSITQRDLDDGSVTNTAIAKTGTTFSNPDTETITAVQKPELTMIKIGKFIDSNGDGYAAIGETISYTFTVKNTGNITLHDVTLVDTIGGVTIHGNPIPTLLVGTEDSSTFSGTYTITEADLVAGHFTNLATVDSDESEPATAEVDVTLPKPTTQIGQLLPTQTTLAQYVNGLRTGSFPYMYDSFAYVSKIIKGKTVINSVSPGVIFYFNRITAPSIAFTMDIVQSNDKTWKPMLVQMSGKVAQASLYDANQRFIANGVADKFGNVHFDLSGLTVGGTYYVMIKYTPANLLGQDVTAAKLSSTYSWLTKIGPVIQVGSKTSKPVQPK